MAPTSFEQNNSQPTGNRKLSGQLSIGLIVALIGTGLLLRRVDAPLPQWVTSWEMILIVVGVFMGIANRFKDISWVIPILVGLVFLIDDIVPDVNIRKLLWPSAMIIIGLIIAFRPKFSAWGSYQPARAAGTDPAAAQLPAPFPSTATAEYQTTADDVLDATAVFGGVKRSVVSKQFRGGEIVAVFGGAEINLAHADFHGVIKLEIVNVLGGTKLIVPANWDVQSVMVAVFGGVEDKRIIRPEMIDPNKKLIIEGTSFLGGLEIRSF
jgi:hypothetical protein